MNLLALIFTLGAGKMSSADEVALFKESAAKILVERMLGSAAEKEAYVCISIEGKAPSAAQIAFFQSLGVRDVGPPTECECQKTTGENTCFRKNSKRPSCSLLVSDFRFLAFTNASASVAEVCGATNGRGEVAKFEKREGVWVYAGSSENVVL